MINSEEFEAFSNSLDRELAQEKARQEKFIISLESEIVSLVFFCFPELESHREEFVNLLKAEAHNHAVEINEFIDAIIFSGEDLNEDATKYVIPDPITEEIERKYLEDVLATLPKSQHESFIKENQIRSKLALQQSDFKFKGHNKLKELAVQYFPEIPDLSSNAILSLNFTFYCSMSLYTEGVFYLTQNYRD